MSYRHSNLVSAPLNAKQDPREMPAYTLADAAHYLKLSLPTLRSWVRGRKYPTAKGEVSFAPLVKLPDRNSPMLSFVNLVEIHVLDAIRSKHNVPLINVRRAIAYLEKHHESGHPLAEQWFQTDGIDLFVEKYGQIINVSRDGQIEMKEIIQAYLHRIERDPKGIPVRLYPFLLKRRLEEAEKEPKLVVIDPRISFGRPVIAGTGIPTEVVAERYEAGDSMAELAEDYGRKASEIEATIRYEFARRQAA